MQEPASALPSSPGEVSEGQSVNFQSLIRQGQGHSTVLLSNVERGWKRKAGGARAEARTGGRRAGNGRQAGQDHQHSQRALDNHVPSRTCHSR